MRYTIRTGIVYRMIADEHFLIAVGETAKICPAIQQINDGGAYYWELLEQGKDPEQMLEAAAASSGMDKDALRPGLERFLKGLEERNYLIPEAEA